MENPELNVEYEGEVGVTLLDHFAGQALNGIMSDVDILYRVDESPFVESKNKTIAKVSYSIAQAMIEERKTRKI